MILLVCGGRTYGVVVDRKDRADVERAYAQRERLWATLTAMHEVEPITMLVHGKAPGADTLADKWAVDHGVPRLAFPADWESYGKAAGPIRNAVMLAKTNPDLVLSFKGGKGTENMLLQAKRAGKRIVTVAG